MSLQLPTAMCHETGTNAHKPDEIRECLYDCLVSHASSSPHFCQNFRQQEQRIEGGHFSVVVTLEQRRRLWTRRCPRDRLSVDWTSALRYKAARHCLKVACGVRVVFAGCLWCSQTSARYADRVYLSLKNSYRSNNCREPTKSVSLDMLDVVHTCDLVENGL